MVTEYQALYPRGSSEACEMHTGLETEEDWMTGEAGFKETTRLPSSPDHHAMPPQAAETTAHRTGDRNHNKMMFYNGMGQQYTQLNCGSRLA